MPGGFKTTPAWEALVAELGRVRDLRLVVFDPLQAFAPGINEHPAAGQFVCGQLGHLAAETGATVLVAHHIRKSKEPIRTLAEARDAIRGTSALVDGLRCAIALWPAEESTARCTCREIGREYTPNAIVQGGVVKANGSARHEVRTYSRRPDGLLRDVTASAGRAVRAAGLLDALVEQIRRAAEAGKLSTGTETGA
jgi:AAA domain